MTDLLWVIPITILTAIILIDIKLYNDIHEK